MIINITIHINEEELRVRATKAYQAAKKQSVEYFEKACTAIDTLANSYCPTPLVARVYTLLSRKQQEWPKHSLMCECRKCKPLNIRTYCKKVMQA